MKIAFSPIVDSNSQVLLLGTMPGEESLRTGQYYGNRNNQFWRIMFRLFNQEFSVDYVVRKSLLISNNIALWDVLATCCREGSLDSNISQAIPNDFASFYSMYPNITRVYFTSRNACNFYTKLVGIHCYKSYQTLPSPSGTYARMNFDEKLLRWNYLLFNSN